MRYDGVNSYSKVNAMLEVNARNHNKLGHMRFWRRGHEQDICNRVSIQSGEGLDKMSLSAEVALDRVFFLLRLQLIMCYSSFRSDSILYGVLLFKDGGSIICVGRIYSSTSEDESPNMIMTIFSSDILELPWRKWGKSGSNFRWHLTSDPIDKINKKLKITKEEINEERTAWSL